MHIRYAIKIALSGDCQCKCNVEVVALRSLECLYE